MDNSTENLIIGLLLAAISGVTFIAYKHPKLYQKEFGPKILNSALFVIGIAIVYGIGYRAGINKLTPFLNDTETLEIKQILESAGVSDYVYIAAIASAIYGGFLSWLANNMLNEGNNEKNS